MIEEAIEAEAPEDVMLLNINNDKIKQDTFDGDKETVSMYDDQHTYDKAGKQIKL